MLIRLFYVSAIVPPLTDLDVKIILGEAQVRNRRLDVTGMMAKSDGHFCQVLEGRSEAVVRVMTSVKRSRHHEAVRVLLEEAIDRRQFPSWAMGLLIRDDLASEMRALHERGQVEGIDLKDVIQQLLTGGEPAP